MHSLTNMQAHFFAAIIEDVLIKLRILVKCDNKLRKEKIEHDKMKLNGVKFNVEPSTIVEELRKIKPHQLECDHYKLNKWIDDRILCDKVLLDTYVELSLKKSYSPLLKYARAVQDQSDHVLFLTDDLARNKILRHDTVRQVRQQRNRHKSIFYGTIAVGERLTVEYKDAILRTKTEERYIDKWQNSRSDQNMLCMQTKEEGNSEAIGHYRKKQDEERQINYSMELYNDVNLNDIMQCMEATMAKYDHDMEAIEIKVHRMHTNYDDQLLKRREMEKKLADHGEKVRSWLQWKKDREIARLHRVKMTQAAVIVQAWWRGLLVRLNLGPFKKRYLKKVSKKGNKKRYR